MNSKELEYSKILDPEKFYCPACGTNIRNYGKVSPQIVEYKDGRTVVYRRTECMICG